ncbi:DUF2637 domain-containing protein [Streptomyces cinereoruber]|uniref:DUF2637 domain-containing protein n=1 Tax=Streptomyces cinereoruber TaxID=67260 RepID=UPI003627B6A6
MSTTPAGEQPTLQPDRDPAALPAAGPTPHTPLTARDYKKWAIRIVLALVMTAALAVGTWSIYTLLTDTFHTPDYIAVFGCGLFDISAIFFALLGQSYATTTDSGLAPRMAMLAMVCASSWVNWKHAQMEKWGIVGGVIFASAPLIAELAFEMWHRFEHRETLRNLGRVAQTLPILGKWSWIAHPLRSRKTLDAHIRAALTEHEAIAELREENARLRAAAILRSAPAGRAVALERADTTTPQSAPPQIPLPATERPALPLGGVTERSAMKPATERPATDARGAFDEGAATPPQSASPERDPGATTPATDDATAPRHESAPTSDATNSESASRHATTTTPAASGPKKADATGKNDTGRQAAKDAILSLYQRHGRRPLESEMVTELKRIRSKHSSRQFAQKIRAELEEHDPTLAALGTDNVRVLTGTDG